MAKEMVRLAGELPGEAAYAWLLDLVAPGREALHPARARGDGRGGAPGAVAGPGAGRVSPPPRPTRGPR